MIRNQNFWRMIPMPTITAGEFRNGVTFEMDGKVMQVVELDRKSVV